MKIIVAEHAGFCFGVQRAVNMALSCADQQRTCFTLGEIIHNPDVVASLKAKNVHPTERIETIPEGRTLIIRSHGAPPEIYDTCKELGLSIVDATCPFVKRIHTIASECRQENIPLIIAGQADHPEIIGICGYAGEHYVVGNTAEAAACPCSRKAVLVAQTTLQQAVYEQIAAVLQKKCEELTVKNTICDTTRARQEEAVSLAKRCTKMIVIGGHNSSNTQKLAQLCKKYCKNTETIENPGQILLEKIQCDDIIGIVAGASTPDWMIREVVTVMNELEKTTAEVEATQAIPAVEEAAAEPIAQEVSDQDSFAEAFEKTLVRIRNGQIITGSVVQIVDGEVCVNIGYKSDGFIPRSEFSSDQDVNPADVVKVGDAIEVEVLKVNDGEGNVLLSRKSVESKKLWDELLEEAETEGKIFEAVGKEVVKGGMIASINGVRAFVPASHVSTKYVENLNEFVGKPMRLSVIEVDKSRKRIVASHKVVMVAEAEEAKKALWGQLEVGSKVNGVVRRLTDFGAFVDIGGIDGLVHVTDVAWGRVKHPSDVLSIGQEIEVLIRDVDVEKQRVSLGYKQLQPKPWTMASEKYPVGSIVEGKVVRIVSFGAFVALEPTIDGLIHISQVGVKRIEKVEDEINVGDVVRCKVLDVNSEAKRISLSRRDVILEENPEIAEQLAAEKAERDRINAERAAERAAAAESAKAAAEAKEAERAERRRARREENEYDLPPVEKSTTSLADLFAGFKSEE